MLKTILTLGPAISSETILSELFPVADRFRLNAAHLSTETLQIWLNRLETLFFKTGKRIPVVLDLQGAKMRIGTLPPVQELPSAISLQLGSTTTRSDIVPVPHEEFFSEIEKGDCITLNDGRIELEILAKSSENASVKILRNGPLSSGKGLNRAQHPIPYRSVSEFDSKMIGLTAAVDFVEYAFSFVNTGEEAELLRPLICGKKLTAKLERTESLQNLAAIEAAFDELWLCRGDLGAQAGLRKMAELQAKFEKAMPGLKKPAWLAGQVLEYMTHFPQPTRTEVVHLARTEQAGYVGIVLSDETAIGKNPLEVCRFIQQWRVAE